MLFLIKTIFRVTSVISTGVQCARTYQPQSHGNILSRHSRLAFFFSFFLSSFLHSYMFCDHCFYPPTLSSSFAFKLGPRFLISQASILHMSRLFSSRTYCTTIPCQPCCPKQIRIVMLTKYRGLSSLLPSWSLTSPALHMPAMCEVSDQLGARLLRHPLPYSRK